ncbi:acyltransferase family protein [Dactylosporangium sp. CA-233914]|uniref:acyltransferase family protein n=1 Tax=Dactylosporangium sp. CA-233914 TaxID=3239934 RepID=UPI003D8C0CF5
MTTERDRAVDALRAIAILGVVLGHWLVTAVVVDGDTVRVASPLRAVPWLSPASWLFQTLALFFFVGGLLAIRSHPLAIHSRLVADRRPHGGTRTHLVQRRDCAGRTGAGAGDAGAAAGGAAGYRRWLAGRLERLFRPVLVLVAVWSALVIAAALWQYVSPASPGVENGAVDRFFAAIRSYPVLKLVASPLWFLLVFAALTMARPLAGRLHPLWPLAVVAFVDLGRFGLDAPAWIGWVNLAAGWLVPFCLGAAWSRGQLRSQVSGWVLLVGGVGATVVLTRWFGYPVSMVGVPGQGISNLNPPTLAAVTFGIAQCGAALLLMPVLRRVMRQRRLWRAVTVVNLSAMTIFLWHQTSLLAVTLLTPGPLAGLHTAPQGSSWVLVRLLWLPVFAAVLVGCWLTFHRFEHRRGDSVSSRGVMQAPAAADDDRALAAPGTR